MNNVAKTTLVAGVAAGMLAGGIVLGAAVGGAIASGDPAKPAAGAYTGTDDYLKNESGQTYGTVSQASSFEREPDLIGATGRDADGGFVDGYVLKQDLYGPQDLTSEEAGALQERLGTGDRFIPLYLSDGKTVVGSFLLSGGGEYYEK